MRWLDGITDSMDMLLLLLSHFSRVRLCANPWTAAHQAPPSLGFSRQEYWSELPFPSPMHACVLSRFSCVRLSAAPWTVAHQSPLSTEFSRQEYWSELPFPSPGDLLYVKWYLIVVFDLHLLSGSDAEDYFRKPVVSFCIILEKYIQVLCPFFSFSFLAMFHGMWDLSSSTRDRTHAPAVEVQSLNHGTTREVTAHFLK